MVLSGKRIGVAFFFILNPNVSPLDFLIHLVLNYIYHFNSLSEKKMFEALKSQLSNDYEVFYSVVWYSKDESGDRINSESDSLK